MLLYKQLADHEFRPHSIDLNWSHTCWH